MISTITSPSLNWPTIALPNGILRRRAISFANCGFELPANTIMLPYDTLSPWGLSTSSAEKASA
ncbi:MAG: hypothetical protein OEW99_10770 [Gammaproteobacteria bacterium]|nr:hypothetical protein [Gammaproteobacteria bacterium]